MYIVKDGDVEKFLKNEQHKFVNTKWKCMLTSVET